MGKKVTLHEYVKLVVKYNADNLNIPAPKIKLVPPSAFSTATTQAAMSSDGKQININKNTWQEWESAEQPFDIWLVISHECRHAWQTRDKEFSKHFKNYMSSASLSLEEYNMQPAEIDAWAWALLIIEQMFGVRPDLNVNLGEQVFAEIMKRKDEISPKEPPVINTLNGLVELCDTEKIRKSLFEMGYFDASKDSRTKDANLQELARAAKGKTEWKETPTNAYCAYYIVYEQFEWIWVLINEYKESDEPFEEGAYIPYETLLFAKKVEKAV